MRNQDTSAVFDQKYASSHDQAGAKLAPMRDALHLFIRMVLSELPGDARVLCVGAGTGFELFALAEAFPHWRFTAVDPAAAMPSICRQRRTNVALPRGARSTRAPLRPSPTRAPSTQPPRDWFLIY